MRRRKSNALQILKKVKSGAISPKEISPQERRLCVAYLRLEGYTQEEMAEVFGVSRQTIVRDEKVIRQEAAKLVDEIDLRAVGGGLIAWARHLTAKAVKAGDHALAWKIQRELLADLQSLGFLPKSPEQHNVQISTFTDLMRAACAENAARTEEAEVPPLPTSPLQIDGPASAPDGEEAEGQAEDVAGGDASAPVVSDPAA